ncbi:GcrA family cell cycle regulator [Kozakia baliensis]|uniref:Uncharacterized protein n=1 Tax=Kozakia baliensis TaxID=153496 RepID=A0A1D8UVH7_9PROT|nr:GcrA family cell cycle regulator [Kozakia baliensis]AOX17628.1 hypothetical protein A0U89_11245 [Kozakia baliensis]GBR31248.1 hypothetical protein AA0488_2225 [Kozakia baliensis NRIC 0488]GEL62887.1 hypothetical protein KBA01_01730 [Kozakia baliensis]
MEWTEEVISRLQELWKEGLSTAEIGRQLSITKNAVVGKAHRLGLPPRPSPIRATGKPRKAVSEDGVVAPAEDKPVKAAPKPKPAPVVSEAKPAESVTAPIAQAVVSPQPVVAAAAAELVKAAPAPAHTPQIVEAKTVEPTPAPVEPPKPQPVKAAEPKPEKAVAPEVKLRPILRPITGDTSTRRGPSCCWPIGDPGTPGFHFCGAKPLPGKPYCAEHAAMAYVKLRDRRESVA